MELRQYFEIVKRWLWLLILGLILGAGGAYAASARQTPVYQSSTKLLVSRAPQGQASYYDYYSDQQLAQTYIQLLTNQPVLDAAGQKLGYKVSGGQISASLIKDTRVILVTIRDTNPVKAADIANTLMSVLIEQNDKLQSGQFAASEESLQTQLKQIESQMNTLQQEVGKASGESLQNQIKEVKTQMDAFQQQVLQLQGTINKPRPTQMVMVTQAAVTPAAGIRVETSAPAFLSITPTLSPEENLVVQQNQFQLDQAQKMMDFYQQIYTSLITSSMNSTDSGNLDQKQNTLALYRQIYANLLASYENMRLARLVSTPNIVQVEKAVINLLPISPRPFNNAGLGGAVGLMIAAGLIFLIEYLDDTVKSPEEITRLFGLPVIGYIAEMEGAKKGKPDGVYVAKKPRAAISEAFRTLRTNIAFSEVERPLRTILITSPTPEEGKTTISVNLAMIMVQGGKKVVIVDADLRRPMVHRYMDIQNRDGLSDIFLNRVSPESVTHNWEKDSRLAVITSGRLPPNPSELLGSETMRWMLEELKNQTDVIIIDSPPFLVSDPSVLASKVDGVLIVLQPGRSRMDSIRVMVEQLHRVNTKIIGVVFNRIPRNRGFYYGGYRYYSRYYYRSKSGSGYHYYDDSERGNGHKGKSKRGWSGFFRREKQEQAENPPSEQDSNRGG